MFNLKQLTFPGMQKPKDGSDLKRVNPLKRIHGRFLKGPVSMTWLTSASRLPGKTLEVGIALWFLSGLNKDLTVRLSNKLLREFGVDRYAKYRALRIMAESNLISVFQQPGQSPVVTILEQGG